MVLYHTAYMLKHVLWIMYNRVGNSVRKAQRCLRLCVGKVRQSLSHQKQTSALNSSSLSLSVTSFPCHLCSLSSSLTLDSRCRLRRLFTFFPDSTYPSSVTQTGSGYSGWKNAMNTKKGFIIIIIIITISKFSNLIGHQQP